jgi:hypothetical protein
MENQTTDHNIIRQWAEKHNGAPQIIDALDALGDTVGIRIDFPGHRDEVYSTRTQSTPITWDRFFEIFEDQKLAFVFVDDVEVKDITQAYHFIKR